MPATQKSADYLNNLANEGRWRTRNERKNEVMQILISADANDPDIVAEKIMEVTMPLPKLEERHEFVLKLTQAFNTYPSSLLRDADIIINNNNLYVKHRTGDIGLSATQEHLDRARLI